MVDKTEESPEASDSFREELVRYAENKKCRKLLRPHSWYPESIINPKSGWPFSGPGAWEYIAELLRNGHPVEVIELDNPVGQRAFVMKVRLEEHKPNLYIKIHFGNGMVLGRSFHYSEIE